MKSIPQAKNSSTSQVSKFGALLGKAESSENIMLYSKVNIIFIGWMVRISHHERVCKKFILLVNL